MKINLIVAAAGQSQRYGVENKLFAPCKSSCVIVEAIKPFLQLENLTKVIVALHPSFFDEFLNMLERWDLHEDRRIVLTIGGDTRTKTVKNALRSVEDDCDCVLIHDGARPYVSKPLIDEVVRSAVEFGSAQPVVGMTDSILSVKNGVKVANRNQYVRVQTPVGFAKDIVCGAYAKCKREFFDDASVVINYLHTPIHIVQGDEKNVKITTIADLKTPHTGIGYDIHRMVEGKGIVLCGTTVECDKKFVAHSDGDVCVHALMDALLTAVGEKDIGHFFPVDDSKYDDACSMDLLKEVLDIVHQKGFDVVNVSICIIAERPRLAPYIDLMRSNLEGALGVSATNIGISVTTNEQVGHLGDGNSIAAMCSVLLQ